MSALTAAQIRARLESDQYGYHDGSDEWNKELADWLSEIDLDAAHAWTHAEEVHDSTATFEPDDVAERFRTTYRQYWGSDWEFARDSWATDLQDCGSQDEAKGRQAMLNDFSSYIDWRAVANSPLLDSYSMVRLGGYDDARVHVFELEV